MTAVNGVTTNPKASAPAAAPSEVGRVGVVGCGTMGSGIAEACARSGLSVQVVGRTPESLRGGLGRLNASVDRAARKAAMAEADRAELLGRVEFGTDLDVLGGCGIVIEAICEQEQDKRVLLSRLERVVDERAVLASTTSGIPVGRLAVATGHPERVIGLHFFSPVPAMPLVELICSQFTDARTRDVAERFVTDTLGKTAIPSPDRTGFVVNTLLIPYLLSAIRMVEAGPVSAESVDQAMVLGCGHPVGPLKLTDMIGLDVVAQVAEALYAEFGEPQYQPPELLTRMVDAGSLGRKAGIGFHDYRRPR
jgi:3-hydroxybutyryl-CoA dehydrogenase